MSELLQLNRHLHPNILSTLTAVVLAGGWGDIANAGGKLAFPLMWGVSRTIAGTAAVTWVLTASAGTMQAHLPLFDLHTRCSGLAAAFQDRRRLNIPLCFSGPVDSFILYTMTQPHIAVHTEDEFPDIWHIIHLLLLDRGAILDCFPISS